MSELIPTQEPGLQGDAHVVAKANEAIAIRPIKGGIGLVSRRIYNALLYHAQQQGQGKASYSVPLAELVKDARFNSKDTTQLKDYIREMQTTLIEWRSQGEGEERWTSSQLLGTVSIVEEGRGRRTMIEWSYPERIRDRLLAPSRYTKVLLEVGARMKSVAASVLFEIGLQYLTAPTGLTMREDVLWWASVLSGKVAKDRVEYGVFKRDTLKPALAELAALQDEFTLELIEHKQGRKVVELQFRVKRTAQSTMGFGLEPRPLDLELVHRLEQVGFKRRDAEHVFMTTQAQALRAALEATERRVLNQALEPLKSPAAYLRDALKKGWGRGDAPVDVHMAQEPSPAARPAVASPAATREALVDEWMRACQSQAEAHFAALAAQERQILTARFEATELEQLLQPVVKAWRQDGPASPLARSSFYRWLSRQLWPEPPTDSELLEFSLSRTTGRG